MKVIVAYRNYHSMERAELFPQVFKVNKGETPEQALERIWQSELNGALADNLNNDYNDPIDEENCWHEDNMALITWEDGDTKEYFIVEVEDYEL